MPREESSEAVQRQPASSDAPLPLETRKEDGLINDRLAQLRLDLDRVLDAAIGHNATRDQRLADAIRYGVIGGGKRFRALLTVLTADLVGGSYGQALRIGAAIECVHAQSLAHDDLPCMDDDDMRRGRLALHRKFDEATAILAGDALLALAFEILADEATHPDPACRANLVLSLARAIGQDGLAGGQMMDLYPPEAPTEQDVFACERRKTSALIRYAVQAGAMLGNCSAESLERLLRFADDLGLLFQIRDDMLDRIGNAQVVGKALDKDEAAGRASATAFFGLEGAANRSSSLETACQEALSGFGPKAMPLRNLVRFAGSRMH